MCGRFTLSTPTEMLAGLFEIEAAPLPDLPARYNIAPTQDVAVVRKPGAEDPRELALLRWGLVPFWAKDPEIGSRMINARAETVAERPAYRAAFRTRRCILPADGFYEWRKEGAAKQPYYFKASDDRPLGMAGLWERWRSPDGGELQTCTIITTEANVAVRPIHPRMPAILRPEDYALWLDPGLDARDPLEALLVPVADDALVGYRVSRRVNAPANDDPEVILPIDGAD